MDFNISSLKLRSYSIDGLINNLILSVVESVFLENILLYVLTCQWKIQQYGKQSILSNLISGIDKYNIYTFAPPYK